MGDRLAGKVAVVTGGASGMGQSTVLRFIEEGASVVVADLNDKNGRATAELVGARGHADCVRFLRVDVAEEEQVEAAVQTAVSEFGGLDIMFNNAGIGGAFGSILETEVEDWDFTFAALARSVFLGIKHAGRSMKAQGRGGSIINTASVAGLSGGAGPIAYSSAKAAVINLSRAAAVELAGERIRVNAICPGGINTPLVHRGNEEHGKRMLEKAQPWPAAGEGTHIAGAALFLASADPEFVTGEALLVDGGLTAMGPSLVQRMQGGADPSAKFDFVGMDMGSTGIDAAVREVESAS